MNNFLAKEKSIVDMYHEDKKYIGEGEEKTKESVEELLSKKLGPEYISYRPGWNGIKVAYIEGWTVIDLANRIFGYDGWSSEIKSVMVDFYEDIPNKVSVGISVVVRITLKSSTFKEDVGFGSSENQKNKVVAWEKARKEAVTDALKRSLRQFGSALGNCCYDKDFLRDIKEIGKKEYVGIDESDLIRKESFRRVSRRNAEILSMDVDEMEFTDSC